MLSAYVDGTKISALDGCAGRRNQEASNPEAPHQGARLAIAGTDCQKPPRFTGPFSGSRPFFERNRLSVADSDTQTPRRFLPGGPLQGRIRVPGDKSISHRALMLSSLAVGTSRISGLLEGEDVLATAAAMRAMGASIERADDGEWRVRGVGVGALLQPQASLDMGNSGTSTRLLMGLVASHPITASFTGDASLSRRPMGRVIDPLSQMGASFTASPGGTLPLMLRGASLSLIHI